MQLKIRQTCLFFIDAVLINIAYYLAYYLRFGGKITAFYFETYYTSFLMVTVVTLISFRFFNLYRSLWRYASTSELINLFLATTSSTAIEIIFIYVFKLGAPRSIILIAWMLIILLVGGTRFSYRILRNNKKNIDAITHHKARTRLMIIGAGDACTVLLREIENLRSDAYSVVVALDDDPNKKNMTINNIPIHYGINNLVEVAEQKHIDEIIIAIPSASQTRISEILDLCRETSCTIKTLPSLEDMLDGKISFKLIRDKKNITSNERLWLSSPHMSDEGLEIKYVQEAFDTNWIAPLGNNVNMFEKELAEKVGSQYAAALVSGTEAIHLALKAAGVGQGDIVFCQSLTFSATANPIIYQNAIPVFIDSDYETWNMDPNALEQAFIRYPEAKAVLVVHLYGLSADMDKIVSICKKYNSILIEDAAESLGTTYKGRYTGTFGEYGIYSFNGNKIITTSGGGMLISNNEERIKKVQFWATQSRDVARHYQHSELGFNYRMSNIVAGIGRGQLQVLDKRVEKKRYIFDYYKKNLSCLEGIEFMPHNCWNEPNFWLTCITLSGEIKPLDIMDALERENIESRPVWKPMHLQPFFAKYDFIGDGVAQKLFETGVCLPSDTKMTDGDLNRVVTTIKKLWGEV